MVIELVVYRIPCLRQIYLPETVFHGDQRRSIQNKAPNTHVVGATRRHGHEIFRIFRALTHNLNPLCGEIEELYPQAPSGTISSNYTDVSHPHPHPIHRGPTIHPHLGLGTQLDTTYWVS